MDYRHQFEIIDEYFGEPERLALLAATLVNPAGVLSLRVEPFGKDENFWRTDRVTQRHIPRYRPDHYSFQYGEHSMPAEPYPNEAAIVEKIRSYIPFSWRDVVCTCYMPTYGVDGRKCTTCKKWARWLFVRRCDTCNQPFVKAFIHPKRETHTSMCYGCLVSEYGDEEAENFVTEEPKDIGDMNSFDFTLPDVISFDLE